jgi:protein-L-isoaspartate(D-aspartate) O-methyltransferase
VLDAIAKVPRHLFMDSSFIQFAYKDQAFPIGSGQTISQPFTVAFQTQLLDVQPNDKILEVGTGSGYQAAVLSPLVKHIYTIEIVPELARSAKAALEARGYKNVTVRTGDGYQGWPEEAPFDRIVVTAAPPEIPKSLLEQLAPGGRLVAPVGSTPFTQELLVVDKTPQGQIRRRSVGGVAFVPMVPAPRQQKK